MAEAARSPELDEGLAVDKSRHNKYSPAFGRPPVARPAAARPDDRQQPPAGGASPPAARQPPNRPAPKGGGIYLIYPGNLKNVSSGQQGPYPNKLFVCNNVVEGCPAARVKNN